MSHLILELGRDDSYSVEVEGERVYIPSPEFNEEESLGLIYRVVFKFLRRCANVLRHRLCYKESMLSSFWYGVWHHSLKPSSV